MNRKPYPSDVTDEEWATVAPYLTLMREDAPQRQHDPRELFNGLRWIVRSGAQWRMMPHDLPPWHSVYQQARRWMAAGALEAMARDFREVLRLAGGGSEGLSGTVLESEAAPDDEPGRGIELAAVKLPQARTGFVLLPRKWVEEGALGRASRFGRLTKDCERLVAVLAGL